MKGRNGGTKMMRNEVIKETLRACDYEVREHRQSKIDPTKTLEVCVGYRCPHCGQFLGSLQHGQGFGCVCGLHVARYGNALLCELPQNNTRRAATGRLEGPNRNLQDIPLRVLPVIGDDEDMEN